MICIAHAARMSVDSPAAQPATPDSLIEQCLGGDQVAWEAIVRQNWRKVFNVAYKFVGKHDEAEDLTQDIFLKIFKALKTFDRRANFQTWIISISRNLCIDHYRSVRKERQTIARDVDTNDLQPASRERTPVRAGRAPGPAGAAAAGARRSCPVTLRTAVVLRDLQELSYQEIADRLGLPEGHGEVADQPRPTRAGAAAEAAARQTASAAPPSRRAGTAERGRQRQHRLGTGSGVSE